MVSTIEIFCCYARKDQQFLDELKTRLIPFQWQGLITLWADTDIGAGVEWEEEIKKHLDTAQIILLLISPDFMASEYIHRKELKRAMERHKRGEARVIPIILRPVHWQDALGQLEALPKDGKPVVSWPNQDDAFYDVTNRIIEVVKQLNTTLPRTSEAKPEKTTRPEPAKPPLHAPSPDDSNASSSQKQQMRTPSPARTQKPRASTSKESSTMLLVILGVVGFAFVVGIITHSTEGAGLAVLIVTIALGIILIGYAIYKQSSNKK